MNQDNFLNYSLAIGFSLVALVYFYEDYSSFLGFGGSKKKDKVERFIEEDPGIDTPASIVVPEIPEEEAPATYIFKADDSVYSIADKFGLTVEELINLNPDKIKDMGTVTGDKKDYFILAGDELKVR